MNKHTSTAGVRVFARAMLGCVAFLIGPASFTGAAELRIGAASTEIVPDRPVALDGQFNTRISRGVDNPLTATAVAIEAHDGTSALDHAIFLSCDLVGIRPTVSGALRSRLKDRLPGFDPRKLIMNATHTHTAPVTEEGKYDIPDTGVMRPTEYVAFLVDRLAEVVERAWAARKPGAVSWGLGHAVVGHNRRAVYADGKAKMYGATDIPEFRGIEGGEDHGIEMVFFYDAAGKPLAAGVNVACPSQEVEGRSTMNADFWHDVREQVRGGPAKDLLLLGWPGACGDISPHRMYRKAAEDRMLKLRGLTYTQEIGRRMAREVNDVLALAAKDIRKDVEFRHRVEDLELPVRKVTVAEVEESRKEIASLREKKDATRRIAWLQSAIDRYEKQGPNDTATVEVHVLRIGDIAIATNPFELFQDYGVQIKGRSRALQTLVIQLTGGPGRYLPSARAVEGGGYSAVIQSNTFGPEGGQVFVDRTVEMIDSMWVDPR